MRNHEDGTTIFNPKTMTFSVKTPKGEFHNVRSIGGFNDYREMDVYIEMYAQEECKKNGLIAYLYGSRETLYIFFYPESCGGGYIFVYREK